MRHPLGVLWRKAPKILRRTACLTRTVKFFSHFHPHCKMSFQATSGTLTSQFSALYAFDTGLLCDLWKRSKKHFNFTLSMRPTSLHIIASADDLFLFERISRPNALSKLNSSLAFLFALTYSFPHPANSQRLCSMAIANLLKAGTSSNIPIVTVVFPRSTGNFQRLCGLAEQSVSLSRIFSSDQVLSNHMTGLYSIFFVGHLLFDGWCGNLARSNALQKRSHVRITLRLSVSRTRNSSIHQLKQHLGFVCEFLSSNLFLSYSDVSKNKSSPCIAFQIVTE